jgi:fibronectin type 3 domain-containing protein
VLIVVLLTTCILFVMRASTVSALEFGDLDYELVNSDAEVEITGYHGAGGSLTIPSEIEGKPVTSIGASAFYGTTITTITIPANVTSIGNSAFASCSSLTSITFNGGAPTVGTDWIADHNSELTIYFYEGKTGFTTPMWEGVPCVQIVTTTVPGAPSGLTATPRDGQVQLSWTAPTDDGGATIDYYIVYQDNIDVRHVTGTATTITGLSNGVSYDFAVAAHNSVGIGAKSETDSATPAAPVVTPGAPTNLLASPGDALVHLSWIAPTNNGGAAIDYYVVYRNDQDVAHVTGIARTINGLTNGISYEFAVAAHNSAGIGTKSSVVRATPLATVVTPGAPTNLVATPGDRQVKLSWTAPANNGGATIDYYVVYQNNVDVAHVTGAMKAVTGLTNGVSYSFKVAAHNNAGIGTKSAAVSATPLATVVTPGAPTNLVATPGDGQVRLSWTAPANNGGAAIDYYVVYRSEQDFAHVTGTSKTVTSLTNGISYSFKVAAHNSAGIGMKSAAVSVTPSPTATVPAVPTGLTATPGDGQVQLWWTAPSNDGGANIDHYVIYQNNVMIAQVSGTTEAVTGLTNGVSISFQVAAHNSAGTGAKSSTVSVTPSATATVPGAPTNLVATPEDGQVQLTWIAPSNDGGAEVSGYQLYWSRDATGTFTSISVVDTSYLHEGLDNGTTYYYRVTAVNSVGESAPTEVVSATPFQASLLPSAPTDLSAVVKNGAIELTWSAPSSDGGSTITGYLVYRGTSPSDLFQLAMVGGSPFVDSEVNQGVQYFYQVVAVNNNGVGAPAGIVDATIEGGSGTGFVLPLGTIAIGVTVAWVAAMLIESLLVKKRRFGR